VDLDKQGLQTKVMRVATEIQTQAVVVVALVLLGLMHLL
jgi:hypothetical protein